MLFGGWGARGIASDIAIDILGLGVGACGIASDSD